MNVGMLRRQVAYDQESTKPKCILDFLYCYGGTFRAVLLVVAIITIFLGFPAKANAAATGQITKITDSTGAPITCYSAGQLISVKFSVTLPGVAFATAVIMIDRNNNGVADSAADLIAYDQWGLHTSPFIAIYPKGGPDWGWANINVQYANFTWPVRLPFTLGLNKPVTLFVCLKEQGINTEWGTDIFGVETNAPDIKLSITLPPCLTAPGWTDTTDNDPLIDDTCGYSGTGIVDSSSYSAHPGFASNTDGQLPIIPPCGGTGSIQLFSSMGDSNNGNWASVKSPTFTIPAAGNFSMSYWLAGVFSSDHYDLGQIEPYADAYMEADVVVNGATVNSIQYGWQENLSQIVQLTNAQVPAAGDGTFCIPTSPNRWGYLPWQQYNINFCGNPGDQVYLKVASYDCSGGAHYGLGYVSCLTFTSTAVTDSMTLTKTNSPAGAVNMGDTITYTLTYKNTGAENATGVVITDTIPANTTFVPGSISSIPLIAMVTQTANTISWTVGNLLPGVSGTLTFQVKVASCGTGIISNRALETDFIQACGSNGILSNVVTNAINGCAIVSATITPTATKTNTPTAATPTATKTNTFTTTPTNTQTRTITPTNTNTPAYSPTSTKTSTPTATITRTNTTGPTPTDTATASVTSTITVTMTITATYTITPTPPPYPYVLKITLYNEAGEKVKELFSQPASALVNIVDMFSNTPGGQATDVFNNSVGNNLFISLPGVETPLYGTDTVFKWEGGNTGEQQIKSGSYYIQISEQDAYGHTSTMTKDLTILNSDEYVTVKVFNSAGEIVWQKTEYSPVVKDNILALSIEKTIVLGKNKPITIQYGADATNSIIWDGKNYAGNIVTNGVYEIQVYYKQEGKNEKIVSKTVTFINDENIESVLGEIIIMPNPYKYAAGKSCIIKWSGSGAVGDVEVRIYGLTGELIKTVYGKSSNGFVLWNGKSVNGRAASGIYIAVVTAKKGNGQYEIKMIKLIVLVK